MNILYGVPGEGMGHATRSKVIIEHLLKSHNVQVVSSQRAFAFLNSAFPNRVHEIKGFHFAYKNSEVSKSATFMLNFKNAPKNFIHNFKEHLSIKKSFTPDLVISDFESFSFFYAKKYSLPYISIDNMQVIDRCKLDISIPVSEKNNYLLSKAIIKAKVPNAEHYYISSFFDAVCIKKNTTIIPPIIREAIISAKPEKGKHVLMYQTSSSLQTVTDILHKLPDINFLVYGFNKNEVNKNVEFKTFSETGFVNDLASAKAVIANGGFSFISEAVYLKKPIFSFPIKNQFEQYVNAKYIEKCGYGRYFATLTPDNLKAFLFDLKLFEDTLTNYTQQANDILFKVLDLELKKYNA